MDRIFLPFSILTKSKMASNLSINSIDSDVFFVQQLSNEPSPQPKIFPNILNSTELTGTHTTEMPTFSSVTSSKPDIVTLDDNSNDPAFPYGFGAQQPFVPTTLNDLNLPPNPFIILAAVTVVQQNPTQCNKIYSSQSPESSEPSPISTPPMNLRTIDRWKTPHTTTDDNTFYSEDEPRRVHWTSPLDETLHSEGEAR